MEPSFFIIFNEYSLNYFKNFIITLKSTITNQCE